MKGKDELIIKLALQAIDMAGSPPKEIERYCWMVVHEHHHGFKPSEYDIREVEEDLYLNVLDCAKKSLKAHNK